MVRCQSYPRQCLLSQAWHFEVFSDPCRTLVKQNNLGQKSRMNFDLTVKKNWRNFVNNLILVSLRDWISSGISWQRRYFFALFTTNPATLKSIFKKTESDCSTDILFKLEVFWNFCSVIFSWLLMFLHRLWYSQSHYLLTDSRWSHETFITFSCYIPL